mgnify:CR=1 FL=1
MLIFEKTGKVTPEQDKTNVVLTFNVPNGTEKLSNEHSAQPAIHRCEFHPSQSLPMQNLCLFRGVACPPENQCS